MPIYEFRCTVCGFSPHAAPFHLVRTPGETRTQERKNAKLRGWTKARFKDARRRAREQRARASGTSGSRGGDG